MPLAFDETALARILIAGTGLPPERQSWLLQYIARELRPAPHQVRRNRYKRGLKKVGIVVTPGELADFLREYCGVQVGDWNEDDLAVLGQVLETFIREQRWRYCPRQTNCDGAT